MSTSDFARRQLEKHGWKKGAGLGKEENGMSNPIKVSLKMDKTGVGHDPGKEFTDHWWLRVFNDAAKKIGNKDQKKEAKSEIDKKKDKKQSFYAGFVKSSTLTNGVEEKVEQSDRSESEDESSAKESVPTLNDIHKFCGGATGHKAARFGFKMGGKLARVAEHDRLVEERLQKHLQDKSSSKTESCIDEDRSVKKCDESIAQQSKDQVYERKKKKKKLGHETSGGNLIGEGEVESLLKKDKTKKKKKDKFKNESSESPNVNIVEEGCRTITNEGSFEMVHKKKRKLKSEEKDENTLSSTSEGSLETVRKKKRKLKSEEKDENTLSCTTEGLDMGSKRQSEEDIQTLAKKKKKRKKSKKSSNCDE